MAYLGSSIRTDTYKVIRARKICNRRDAHVNHLVYWPGPHGEQKVNLIEDGVISGVVEDYQ